MQAERMGKFAFTWRSHRSAETPSPKAYNRDDPAIKAHLEAYIAAFIGTEQEFMKEFEEASIEDWRKRERSE